MHHLRSRAGRLLLFFVACACADSARAQSGDKPASDAELRQRFLTLCATCHGENGDGKGTSPLEKPARNFKDGGFAYGNTPEAILRTLTYGIPGTPMPSFSAALSAAQRKEMAAYVIALGPKQLEISAQESLLVVHDKPLVARGKLPPIVAGALERPRGLLIGLPEGLSFEYRTDDVKLLGARQGEFADRKDWRGRGGDFLEPLGKLVWTDGGGNPGDRFRVMLTEELEHPLAAQLGATWVRGTSAGLSYELHDGDAPAFVRVEESPRAFTCEFGSGFARRLSIEALSKGRLVTRTGFGAVAGSGKIEGDAKTAATIYSWGSLDSDGKGLFLASGNSSAYDRWRGGGPTLNVEHELERGAKRTLELVVLPYATVEPRDASLPRRMQAFFAKGAK
jgi:mono/diheme cytochrome c family protein